MRGPAARPIVIAAGGTGGHFFPAEALAAELIARGHRIVLMTDSRSGALKSAVFAGHESHVLEGAGIAGRGFFRAMRAVLSLCAGTLQAHRLLRQLNPAAIVGFGGYPSVAPMIAASFLRYRPKRVLHEQNAVLGRANRFLARYADGFALGFADTVRLPQGVPSRCVGNPVRPAIAALHGEPYTPPAEKIALFVIGGSLGARVFSDIVPAALAALPDDIKGRLTVTQQCRQEDFSRVQAAYAAAGIEANLAPFFQDVAARYAAAHLVISRAGASSCAEIATIGRPVILVPLPGAIDDHQTANARALTGAVVIRQTDFTADRLSGELRELFANPEKLATGAQLAAKAAHKNAAGSLADVVERLAAGLGAVR